MRRRVVLLCLLMILVFGGFAVWKVARARRSFGDAPQNYRAAWSPDSAAGYLDAREVWWQNWPSAQKEQGTVCISCHTVVPYALVRPALRQTLHEQAMPAPEKTMLASVLRRVSGWNTMTPFYTDADYGPGKSAQSRATEAVLNAVILSSYDAASGQLTAPARAAYDAAWALQETSGPDAGGWQWQDFHLAPWESSESAYQGAALFAVALGNAPDRYMAGQEIADHVRLLKDYLRAHYASQPVMSQVYVLWAAQHMPGLLSDTDKQALIATVRHLQMGDGGWTLTTLNRPADLKQYLWNEWNDLTNFASSDGCATGLVVLALQASGMTANDRTMRGGIDWLRLHQTQDGSWWAASLNERRDPASDIGRFMSDAATGYAVLALEVTKQSEDLAAVRSAAGHPPRTE
jgi:squalene-hopene/tetraprenyl-beta-curcumene cyclase